MKPNFTSTYREVNACLTHCLNSDLNVKALVGAFNQEPSRGLLRDCTSGCGTDGSFHSTIKDAEFKSLESKITTISQIEKSYVLKKVSLLFRN